MTSLSDLMHSALSITRTVSVSQPQPYTVVSNADANGNQTAAAQAVPVDAEAIFPTINGTTKKLSTTTTYRPPGFTKSPSDPTLVADFSNWNSGWQKEYVSTHGSGTPPSLVIGGATFSLGSTITAVVSAEARRVYIVDYLQKSDFGFISQEDQAAIAQTTAFKNDPDGLGLRYGLAPTGNDTPDAKRNALKAICDTYKNNMVRSSDMTTDELAYFTDAITRIKTKLDQQSIFDEISIKQSLEDIKKRYDLAYAFSNFPSASTVVSGKLYNNVKSNDDDVGLKSGYRTIINNEQQIGSIDIKMLTLSTTGAVSGNKILNGPQLVALMQLYTNLRQTYVISTLTEEINQQNALLKAYSAMQTLVSQTSSAFSATGSIDLTSTKEVQGASGTLTSSEAKIVSMFDATTATQAKNPLETLNSWIRPTLGMISNSSGTLTGQKKSAWDAFGTNLGDSVQLISNQTQLKSDAVNKTDGERNKHFDLANSSIARMNDVINNIMTANDI